MYIDCYWARLGCLGSLAVCLRAGPVLLSVEEDGAVQQSIGEQQGEEETFVFLDGRVSRLKLVYSLTCLLACLTYMVSMKRELTY